MENLYLIILCMAAIAGIGIIIKAPVRPISLLALLTIYAAMVELSVSAFTGTVSVLKDGKNVMPQYNILILVEFLIYGYFLQYVIQSPRAKTIIRICLYIFPAFWYYFVFCVFSILEWNSYTFLIGGTLVILGCLLYFHELLKTENLVLLKQNSEFWIIVGLSIFYITVVPYMGMYQFLSKNLYLRMLFYAS